MSSSGGELLDAAFGVEALDRNGNMKYTVDFRSLYATVLERWLGQDSAATDTMLGATYPRLGFL